MSAAFIEKIRQTTGGSPSVAEITPGKLIRFATSDRRGDESGWCKLFADGEGGVFGCWRQGISETWQAAASKDRAPGEQVAFLLRVKQAQQEAARLEAEKQAECRKKSAELWEAGRDAEATHPYLLAKQIKPYGVRQLKENLIVPVRDSSGTLHGLQFIRSDGSKKYKTGTAVAGCYQAMGKPNGKLLVCEGFATGATLHGTTGHAVACAFNAGNLQPVCKALRVKFPSTTIIVCADDDHATEGNPGIAKATEAARAVDGLLAVPVFPDNRGPKDTDFNDLARISGAATVLACLEAAAPVTPSTGTPSGTIEEPGESNIDPLAAVVNRLAKLSLLQYDLAECVNDFETRTM